MIMILMFDNVNNNDIIYAYNFTFSLFYARILQIELLHTIYYLFILVRR